jgi:hypothetical protein
MEPSIASEIGEAGKREALRRVLASNAFHRSDQLRSLLRYLCQREFEGRGESLDEYTVAVEALGRPRDYSAFEDGAARNRVHNLRRRLEQYYHEENPDDPIQIVLPKGTYCPVFHRHTASAQPELRASAVVDISPRPAAGRFIPLRTAILVSVATALVAAALATALRPPAPGPDRVLVEAWGPLLAKNAHPLICISTAAQLTAIQRPIEPPARPTITSPDLLAWYQSLPGLPPAREIYLGPSLTSPFWGDVAAALAVSQVLNRAGIAPEALPESAIQLPALNKRNLLLFGRPGFSKTIDLYLRDKPFRVHIPDEHHSTTIWNVEPKPGEPAEFDAHRVPGREDSETAYGLITVMPSWGDANLRMVLFSGTLSPGTQAAGEFFCVGEAAGRLAAALPKGRICGLSVRVPGGGTVERVRHIGVGCTVRHPPRDSKVGGEGELLLSDKTATLEA